MPPALKLRGELHRENLRFYGVPEIKGEENTEAVLKAFFEKELNVENTQCKRVHHVGKRD